MSGAQNTFASEIFRVHIGQIKAHAESEVVAKEKALKQVYSLAWQTLFKRLTLPQTALVELTNDQINNLLESFAVRKEAFGGGIYEANFEVQFSRSRVLDLFQTHQVDYAEQPASGILVLPLFKALDSGEPQWLVSNSANQWLKIWSTHKIKDPDQLVPYIVPLWDLQDRQIIQPDQVIARNPVALNALLVKYNTRNLLFSSATLFPPNSKGQRKLSILLEFFGREWNNYPIKLDFLVAPSEPEHIVMQQALNQVIEAIHARWKQNHLIVLGRSASKQYVSFNPSNLTAFLKIQDTLKSLARISDIKIKTLNTKNATLQLTYRGFASQLQQDLSQVGIEIIPHSLENHAWQLKLSSLLNE
ncbi:MAG: DUF2066 domain-containing protein [Pseudomonadota bacterium]